SRAEGDAPRADESRRRDRREGRGRGRRARHDAGPERPRRPDGRALRPARAGTGAGRGRGGCGGGRMLFAPAPPKADLVLEGRVIDPSEGIDANLRVTVENGVVVRLEPTGASRSLL